MKKALVHQVGDLQVRQYFDHDSQSWLTMVVDSEGLPSGEVEFCSYGDKESRRRQLILCKKRARDIQGLSGLRGASVSS